MSWQMHKHEDKVKWLSNNLD